MRMVKRGTHATPTRLHICEMPPAAACLHTVTTCNGMRVRAEGPQGIDIATDIYEHLTAPMRAFSQTLNIHAHVQHF